MQTTVDFLNALRERLSVTDYALARELGVTKQQVSRYRHRHDLFSDELAERAAELLQLDPGYVLACIAAERTKSERARRTWEALAKKLSGAVVLLFLAVLLSPYVESIATSGALHIMLSVVGATALLIWRLSIAHARRPDDEKAREQWHP